jgi:polyisoprenoid-binding protein YceI
MKRLTYLLSLFLLLPVLAQAVTIDPTETDKNKTTQEEAPKWSFDKAHSAVSFSIRHIFTPVRGEFSEYSGDVYFDPNNLDASSVDVIIQVSSIDTKNGKRDGHLQSPDFFNAEKYPEIRFTADEFKKTGNNEFVAMGELTIKDVTKEFELPFTLLGVGEHPMMKGTKIAAMEMNTKLMRNNFNVGTGDWTETAVVGDEVDIKITLELLNK